jgi:protein required for attachment to host cells
MKKKWIVVAESSRARIYSVESRTSPLKEIDDIVNMSSLQDMSANGQDQEGNGQGGRHALEPRIEPKKLETVHFAHDVSERLETARRVGDYNDLVIISSPGFLGMLKQNLGTVTQKHISQTINKNLIHKSEAEIRDYVFH